MKVTVFDLETKLRPGKPEEIASGKSDCLWTDFDKMGISTGASFSYESGEYAAYLDDNVPDLWKLLHASDLVVGYNIVAFDLPLILATMKGIIKGNPVFTEPEALLAKLDEQYKEILAKSFDMLLVIKDAAKATKYTAGYRVDDVLQYTFGKGAMKTGNGAFAPDLFKQGKMGELITYCLGDVHRERRIFERMAVAGRVRAMGHKAGQEDILTPPIPGLGFLWGKMPYPMDSQPLSDPSFGRDETGASTLPPPIESAQDVLDAAAKARRDEQTLASSEI